MAGTYSMFLLKYYRNYSLLINYCIIGCTGASLDFILFVVLTSYFGIFYQYANFISISCGILNNFFLNAIFNFKRTSYFWYRMFSFYAVGMIGWAISSFLLYLLIEKLNLNTIIAKLSVIIVITCVQFFLNKLITFRSRRHEAL